jgi:cyclic dehypoxanthinyl futalosine synthase
MSKISGMEMPDLLRVLKEAGLDSVPGAGAEILSERMRKILSPAKATVDEWVHVMESCHREGLPGTANIVFGSEETREEVIEHLNIIRGIQDRTGGFLAFIPWTFQQQTKAFKMRKVPPHEYLKVLGISRIFLDNIDHIESSVMVLGPVLGGLALHAGADDISSIVIEENVLRNNTFTEEQDARNFLELNGFSPRYRDFDYNYMDRS